jgi:hypothetical protein
MRRATQAEKIPKFVNDPLLRLQPWRDKARTCRGATELREEEAITGHGQDGTIYCAVALIAHDVLSASDGPHTVHIAVDVDPRASRQQLIPEQIGEQGEAASLFMANDLAPFDDLRRIDELDAGRKVLYAIVSMEAGSVPRTNE